MIEKNAVAGEHVVGLAVVDHDPVGVQLGDTVRGSFKKIGNAFVSLLNTKRKLILIFLALSCTFMGTVF